MNNCKNFNETDICKNCQNEKTWEKGEFRSCFNAMHMQEFCSSFDVKATRCKCCNRIEMPCFTSIHSPEGIKIIGTKYVPNAIQREEMYKNIMRNLYERSGSKYPPMKLDGRVIFILEITTHSNGFYFIYTNGSGTVFHGDSSKCNITLAEPFR